MGRPEIKQQVEEVLGQHTWSVVPGTIDVEMITNQLVDLIERIVEAHVEALSFDEAESLGLDGTLRTQALPWPRP